MLRVAAAQAVDQRLLVISGGPGTGKTATVVCILALAHQLALAMFVLACAAVTLVAGQLYMQQSMDAQTFTGRHVPARLLGTSPATEMRGHARPDFNVTGRP